MMGRGRSLTDPDLVLAQRQDKGTNGRFPLRILSRTHKTARALKQSRQITTWKPAKKLPVRSLYM